MSATLLTLTLILFRGINYQFCFFIDDTPYTLEVNQDNFDNSYQFGEHTSDNNIWVFNYPQNNILRKITHDGNIVETIYLQNFFSNHVYTTQNGSLLSISNPYRELWYFNKVQRRWSQTGEVLGWLGTWSVDEKDGVIMIAEYCRDTDPYARVFRSKNGGASWDIVFYQRAYGSESPEVRHFHTIQVDPYTGHWYLSSGDRRQESKIFKSKDDGDTWLDVTDYNLDPSLPPALKTQSLFRLTTFWFTEDYICWATDDRINNLGAHLVISPRTEPLDVIVIGRTSYNEVRSAIEYPNIGWLLITENRTGYAGIELTFVTKDLYIIPLGILEGITDNFSASIASKRADWRDNEKSWVGYSLARGVIPRIMRYKLKQNLKLQVTSNIHLEDEIIIIPKKDCGYTEGDIVNIQVKEKPGYIFTGWEGDFCTSRKNLTVEITKDIRLKAHFYPIDMEPDYKVPATFSLTLFLLTGLLASLIFIYVKTRYTVQ